MAKKPDFSEELQRLKEICTLIDDCGENLPNMDPDLLRIIEDGFVECLKTIRGENKDGI